MINSSFTSRKYQVSGYCNSEESADTLLSSYSKTSNSLNHANCFELAKSCQFQSKNGPFGKYLFLNKGKYSLKLSLGFLWVFQFDWKGSRVPFTVTSVLSFVILHFLFSSYTLNSKTHFTYDTLRHSKQKRQFG